MLQSRELKHARSSKHGNKNVTTVWSSKLVILHVKQVETKLQSTTEYCLVQILQIRML